MLGYSPPSREVAPPPRVRRHDMLIHVDRVEDWSPLSPRSSQSGLPSSESDDARSVPSIWPGTWTMHVEDGQGTRRHPALVAPSGCGSVRQGGPRDRDDHDTDKAGWRSWKDALLGCKQTGGTVQPRREPASSSRQRSRTPISRRNRTGGGTSGGRPEPVVLKAMPPLPLAPREPAVAVVVATAGQDPVAEFFRDADPVLPPPPRVEDAQL
ncbi:hypothetical protein VPH35_009172 [Triticum aestivum]